MKKVLLFFVVSLFIMCLIGCGKNDVYTVSFNSNGGSEIPSQEIVKYEKVIEPQAPTKEGYEFIGWYVGTERWSFLSYNVTANITLEAKWKKHQKYGYDMSEYIILPEYNDSNADDLSDVFEYIVENSIIINYPQIEFNMAKKELENTEKAFKETYGIEFDIYIRDKFSMTRDEYIKSNMKSEMVYYAIKQKENIEPTQEQLSIKKVSLIAYYEKYYRENENLNETDAKNKARDFVENLGDDYIYEKVIFKLVDELLIKKVTEKE